MIPSETDLTKKYDITRTTVRKAIANLVNEGMLELVSGKGTFVRLKELKYSFWNFGGFSDYVKKQGEEPVSILIENEVRTINEIDYFILKRARGLKREDSVKILTIDTSKLLLEKYPNITDYDFEKESLYEVLRTHYQVFPKYSEISLSIKPCDEIAGDIFNINTGEYLLTANVSVTNEEGELLETTEVVYGPQVEFNLITEMR